MMQNAEIAAEPVGLEYLEQVLRTLGVFYYWPNEGNLGDYLIAEATRQVFREMGLEWKEYEPGKMPGEAEYNLVYGGGGRFVHHWGGMELFEEHLTRSQVQRCVVLPHSINGVDAYVQALDERHTVFCRELRTLEYCRGLNQRASFVLAHDLGISLRVEQLPSLDCLPVLDADATAEAARQYELLNGTAARRSFRSMRLATVESLSSCRKVAFVLRTDREKNEHMKSDLSYDLSRFYSASCKETPYTALLVRFMADCLSVPDVVVTDRLHVAIMAMHMGKDVYMLDNDYGKLSGVYEVSLKNRTNVHLILPGEPWPEELTTAWERLNAPWRRMLYLLPEKLWKKAKQVLKKLLRR